MHWRESATKIAFGLTLFVGIFASIAFIQSSRVNVCDLGRNVKLIGILGEPLGTAVKIKGKWHLPREPEKDSNIQFSVLSIDDRKLDMPLVFYLRQLQITEDGIHELPLRNMELNGQEWTMIAYETGTLYVHGNFYPEATIEKDRDPNSVFTSTPMRYFNSQLIARRIELKMEQTNNGVNPSPQLSR